MVRRVEEEEVFQYGTGNDAGNLVGLGWVMLRWGPVHTLNHDHFIPVGGGVAGLTTHRNAVQNRIPSQACLRGCICDMTLDRKYFAEPPDVSCEKPASKGVPCRVMQIAESPNNRRERSSGTGPSEVPFEERFAGRFHCKTTLSEYVRRFPALHTTMIDV